MKQIILLLTLGVFLIAQTSVVAQKSDNHKKRWEKYKTEKVAFLTTNLDLTPQEAQKFWPVYNEMENKRESITHDLMKQFFYPEERPEDMLQVFRGDALARIPDFQHDARTVCLGGDR